MTDCVAFKLGDLVQALADAQTSLPDAREPGYTWAVATERRRATTAVKLLLASFEEAIDPEPYFVDHKVAVWRLAGIIEECAPWTALKRAAKQVRTAAESRGWEVVVDGPRGTTDPKWQTEWHDEDDLELRWDETLQQDVPRAASA